MILIAQVLLGAVNVWVGEHAWLIVAHLAVGTLLWVSLIRFAFTLTLGAGGLGRRSAPPPSVRPPAGSPAGRRAG